MRTPRDPDAFADAVLRLLADPAKAADMGQRGRQLVVERMAIAVRGDAIEALYADALRFDAFALRH